MNTSKCNGQISDNKDANEKEKNQSEKTQEENQDHVDRECFKKDQAVNKFE